jgi:hypothetical protein
MHKPLSCHPLECTEVHMAELGVLVTRILVPVPRIPPPNDSAETDWACNVDVEHVQSSWAMVDKRARAYVHHECASCRPE